MPRPFRKPGRRELLEALFDEETDAVCAAASTVQGEVACDRFLAWLPEFFSFFSNKRHIAAELLEHTDRTDPLVGDNRSRVLAAAAPLLDAAQRSGDIEPVLTIEQILDLVHAVAAIQAPATYLEPILRAALDGSGPKAAIRSDKASGGPLEVSECFGA